MSILRSKVSYDLYLSDGSTNILGSSYDSQTGTQPPTEDIILTAPYTGIYYVSIKKFAATANHKLSLFVLGKDLSSSVVPSVVAASIVSPSDAAGAFSVGAIDYSNWLSGPVANYSSQGPTNDGRLKPEISAPASVSTYSMGVNGFAGTSASAPHVAGAAALILSAYPYYSLNQLWNSLVNSTIDMGTFGPDNVYGFGRLNMPTLPPPLTPTLENIGVFRNSKWYLDKDGSGSWSGYANDRYSAFGLAGDVPVSGDWNGDVYTEIGVFRAGKWYLDFSGDGSWSGCGITSDKDRCYSFGTATDKPIIGDWDGGGFDKIGVFREGKWYVDYDGTGSWTSPVDKTYSFGAATDVPVTGDWNNDGKTEIGTFRSGQWYLDYTATAAGPAVERPLTKTGVINLALQETGL